MKTEKKRIPAGWISSRKKAYKLFRVEQYKKLNSKVLTETEISIQKRKDEIIRLHS